MAQLAVREPVVPGEQGVGLSAEPVAPVVAFAVMDLRKATMTGDLRQEPAEPTEPAAVWG
jgi:hypothetical protein